MTSIVSHKLSPLGHTTQTPCLPRDNRRRCMQRNSPARYSVSPSASSPHVLLNVEATIVDSTCMFATKLTTLRPSTNTRAPRHDSSPCTRTVSTKGEHDTSVMHAIAAQHTAVLFVAGDRLRWRGKQHSTSQQLVTTPAIVSPLPIVHHILVCIFDRG